MRLIFILLFLSTTALYSEKYSRQLKHHEIPPRKHYIEAKRIPIYTGAFERAFEFIARARVWGDIAEFGTCTGVTAKIIAERMNDWGYSTHLHLFDSFEGLPEIDSEVDLTSYEVKDFKHWASGGMAPPSYTVEGIRNTISKIIPPNHLFIHKGFFSETFNEDTLPNKLSIIHIDCDLYQSALEVLTRVFEYGLIQDGTMILFDDYNCNRAHPNYGERLAFREVLEKNTHFEAELFYFYGWHGAAFIIHDMNR